MMSDLAVQIGQLLAWGCTGGLLLLGLWCVREGVQEARARYRLEKRIQGIGYESHARQIEREREEERLP